MNRMYTTQMQLPRPARQRGVALIIALVFLLMMTMIGVTGMRSTTMQERMAGNARDRNIAFQAAEASLRSAETELFGFNSPPSDGDAPYYYDENDPLFATADWWAGFDWENGDTASVSVDGAGDAQYVVQEMGAFQPGTTVHKAGTTLPEVYMYRITARGEGKNPNTAVFLQSSYKYGSQ